MRKKKPRVLVLRTAGTNCNEETAFAFRTLGAEVAQLHINRFLGGKDSLEDYHILVIPGGFSYGDDIAAGKILANELRLRLGKDIQKFIRAKKLILGICNGFQVLVKAGLLPGEDSSKKSKDSFAQQATLMTNDSGKFEDRWVHLKVSGRCIWTKDIKQQLYFPVAHAEGKFVPLNKRGLEQLQRNGQVIFRYCSVNGDKPIYPDNPNGSVDDIAGICDRTGRILGMMPHPERHFFRVQHPYWTRLKNHSIFGDGAQIFQNGMEYVKKAFL